MRIAYYGYSFINTKNNNIVLNDIRDFLKSFVIYENPKYKLKFKRGDEYLILLHVIGDLYLFVQTRSNEIIQKVNAASGSVEEIYDLLEAHEMIGFASYVYVQESYIGFASTVLAPKANVFLDFINRIFFTLNINNYKFQLDPLVYQALKDEALNMPFIGTSSMKISKENSFFEDVFNLVGGCAEDFNYVDSLEVTIKPIRGKNINKAVKTFLSHVSDDGVEKMLIKAKDELHGQLLDIYLVGHGVISDLIKIRDKGVIAQKIKEKIEENIILRQKVEEHESNEGASKDPIECICRYHDARAWPCDL